MAIAITLSLRLGSSLILFMTYSWISILGYQKIYFFIISIEFLITAVVTDFLFFIFGTHGKNNKLLKSL